MNSNEKFVLALVYMSCLFGLMINFMSDSKAALYASIPTALIGIAATYLNPRSNSKGKDNDNNTQ